jgi:hypothetical protein
VLPDKRIIGYSVKFNDKGLLRTDRRWEAHGMARRGDYEYEPMRPRNAMRFRDLPAALAAVPVCLHAWTLARENYMRTSTSVSTA